VPTLAVHVARELGGALGSGLLLSGPSAAAVGAAVVAALLGAGAWRLLAERNRALLLLLWIVPLAIAMLGYARAIAL
jgi:hypothetical protein